MMQYVGKTIASLTASSSLSLVSAILILNSKLNWERGAFVHSQGHFRLLATEGKGVALLRD